jgi:aminoglycoside phosphotransferase (APT) family kinase protein
MTGLSRSELAAIGRQLTTAGASPAGELSARLITGGRSNLTYLLEDGEHRWVLRRPPAAGSTPSAHDVAREFRVTSALATVGIPVPAPLLLCADLSVLGAPFTVVDFVDGTSLQTREDINSLDDVLIASAVDDLVANLARLHAVDPAAVGLDSFGRTGGYAARQLRRWSSQWDIVGQDHAEVPAPALAERLRASVPDQARSCVVHGDYRCDNTLVDLTDDGRVLAIVDWELSTIGDPVADVAMMCAYRHPAFDLVVGFPAAWTSPRLPSPEALAAKYEAAGDASLPNWEFHMALAYYKLAVIAAGIDHRYRAGGTVGSGFDQAGDSVSGLIEAGLAALEAG